MSFFAKHGSFRLDLEKHINSCKTVFEEIGDHTSSSLVSGFIRDLNRHRYSITIIGGLKRGKSTLLNAMMARNNDYISPISSEVCTSAIIKYSDKNTSTTEEKTEHAVIYFEDIEQSSVAIPLNRLREYVTEAQNPGNRKKVSAVEVFGDFPNWSKAVTIIDSPGHGSVFSHHDTLLSDFLPYTDAIILLVAADIPLDGGDIALLKELTAKQKQKIFFVLTKVDNIDNPDDLPEVIDYVKGKICENGFTCEKLYTVSAKPVYEALLKGLPESEIENIKSQNGILELEKDLEEFIVTESDQTQSLKCSIEVLLAETAKSCNNYITNSKELLSNKYYDLEKFQAEEAELMDNNKRLRNNSKESLRKFEREWRKISNRFERNFSFKTDIIKDKTVKRLEHSGLLNVISQSFKLKQMVQRTLVEEVRPMTLDLEEKLEQVIYTLDKEFEEEFYLYVKEHPYSSPDASNAAVPTAIAVGTIALPGTLAVQAIANVSSSFSAYLTAVNSVAGSGAIPNFFSWTFGGGAYAAKASALGALTSSIIPAIGFVAATWLTQRIAKNCLVASQKSKVSDITEQVVEEMKKTMLESLENYKSCIVKAYEQQIEDKIADSNERIAEVKSLMSDNPEERVCLETRVEKVQNLLMECVQIQKQIPLLS